MVSSEDSGSLWKTETAGFADWIECRAERKVESTIMTPRFWPGQLDEWTYL